ncbi:hypothetical protein AGMMS49525_01530 [Bacteroidia bacterium]|nr:hypothetical protein AGMMS49525_01530 [Bacteroidia bacterium]
MKKIILFTALCLLSVGVFLQAQQSFLTLVSSPGAYFASIPEDIYIQPGSATSDGGQYSSDAISKAIDGDMSTMYHSSGNGFTSPVTLSFLFEPVPADIDYIVYNPRTSGSNGNFKEIEVWYRQKGGTNVKYGNYDFAGSASPSVINFSSTLTNIDRIQIIVKSGVGDGNKQFASCAEMQFFRKNPSAFDTSTIFADAVCSELKPDINLSHIKLINNDFFRDLALKLLQGTYDKAFRVDSFAAYRNPVSDATRLKTAKYGIMDNPTGIAVRANEKLVILVDGIPDGQSVSLKVQDLEYTSDAATRPNYYNSFNHGPEFVLHNGINKLTMPATLVGDGLGYVRYYYTSATRPAPVKLHIIGGRVNGYFDSSKSGASNATAQTLLNKAVTPVFDLKGQYAVATFKVEDFKAQCNNRMKDVIDIYDRIVWLEWKFMGLLSPAEGSTGFGGRHDTRAYFVYQRMPDGVGANASDYRTAYPDANVVNPNWILNENGYDNSGCSQGSWVFGHEHGHVNQTRPGLRWAGTTEVTNNLHSIYVQTQLPVYFPASQYSATKNRMQKEAQGEYVNRYEKAFNWFFADRGVNDNVVNNERPHSLNDNSECFNKMVVFWQLHLFLTEVLGMTGTNGNGFYEDIYEHYRLNMSTIEAAAKNTTGLIGQENNGYYQSYFVKLMSEKANLNLEDFFRKWGFLALVDGNVVDYGSSPFKVTTADTTALLADIRRYTKPQVAIEYLTDANVNIYKDQLALVTGSNYTGSRIPSGWTNAVAYEIREASTGFIKYVLTTARVLPSFFNPDTHKIYAVGYDGERREIPTTVNPNPPAPTALWEFNNTADLLAPTTGTAPLVPVRDNSGINQAVVNIATAGITSVTGPSASNGAIKVPKAYGLRLDHGSASPVTTYTLAYDIKVPLTDSYYALLFTHNNSGDGDFFIKKEGSAGLSVSGFGYSTAGAISANTWHRVVFVVTDSKASVYIDGSLARAEATVANTRWNLQANSTWLFSDDGTEDGDIEVAGISYWNSALTGTQISNLGVNMN